jgi:hypothetical protein
MNILLRTVFSIVFITAAVIAQSEESLVPNYEFDNGTNGWWIGKNDPAGDPIPSIDGSGALSGDNALMIEVSDGGTEGWHILAIAKVALDSGKTYKLEFMADADMPLNASVRFANAVDPYEDYSEVLDFTIGGDDIEFGPLYYTYDRSDEQIDVKYFLGGVSDVTIWLDWVVVLESDPTAPVEEPEFVVQSFSLDQNFPNPFNPQTRIVYQLPEQSDVNLTIFDLSGRKLKTLVQSDLSAGSHAVSWNGTDEQGRAVSSGMYLYQITAKGKQQVYSDSKKMLLIR